MCSVILSDGLEPALTLADYKFLRIITSIWILQIKWVCCYRHISRPQMISVFTERVTPRTEARYFLQQHTSNRRWRAEGQKQQRKHLNFVTLWHHDTTLLLLSVSCPPAPSCLCSLWYATSWASFPAAVGVKKESSQTRNMCTGAGRCWVGSHWRRPNWCCSVHVVQCVCSGTFRMFFLSVCDMCYLNRWAGSQCSGQYRQL